MQSGLRWGGGRPVVGAPCSLRAPRAVVRSPLWSACAVALVSCSASIPVSGLRPVITSLPLPTHRGLAAARHWPCAPAARPPPVGAPSARAKDIPPDGDGLQSSAKSTGRNCGNCLRWSEPKFGRRESWFTAFDRASWAHPSRKRRPCETSLYRIAPNTNG